MTFLGCVCFSNLCCVCLVAQKSLCPFTERLVAKYEVIIALQVIGIGLMSIINFRFFSRYTNSTF